MKHAALVILTSKKKGATADRGGGVLSNLIQL